jgi:hypothetical protein
MKPILLVAALACAHALVVPPRGLAQRRRNRIARRSFFDEDDEDVHEEPHPYAVRDLYELSGTLGNYSVSTTLALRAHALELRETGFRPSADDGQRALGALVPVVAELEAAAAVEAPVPTQCP